MGLSRPRKLSIALSAILVLSFYYYFYFYEFDQGVSEAPASFALIKLASLALFYASVFRLRIKNKFTFLGLLLIVSACLLSVTVVLKSIMFNVSDLMFFNMIIFLLPFLVFSTENMEERLLYFFDVCVALLSLQVFLDTYIYIYGTSLWNNKAFVGGLGNPSVFGLVCVFMISYLLMVKGKSFKNGFFLVFLTFGVVMTNAMLPYFVMAIVYILWLVKKRHFLIISLLPFLAVILFLYKGMLLPEHLAYKMDSLYSLFFGQPEQVSISISGRVEMYEKLLSELDENFWHVIFFGYPRESYYIADSQYLTYIGSFGILSSSVFFVLMFLSFVKRFERKDSAVLFSFSVLIVVFFAFFTNRILDYFPIPLFIFSILYLNGGKNQGTIMKSFQGA